MAHQGSWVKPLPLAIVSVMLAMALRAEGQVVRFVNAAAPPKGDGLTWATAYNDLQTAIADGNATEIRVAAGTYSPGDQWADTFQLRDGLAIIGGFGGETILSGDVLGDDVNGVPGIDNNSHVVSANGAHATLSRVTVTGGTGDFSSLGGGAIRAIHSSLAITACRFDGNVGWEGGAIYVEGGWAGVVDCDFGVNRGRYGGGVASRFADTAIIGCKFDGSPYSEIGGGLYLAGGTHAIIGCSFRNMTCDGAGIWVGGATAKIVGCRFINSRAILWGGSAIWSGSTDLEVIGCAFIGNDASDSYGGGAVWAEGGSTRIEASLFFGNAADGHGSAVHVDDGTLSMQANLLIGNSAPAVVTAAAGR